MIKDFNVTKYWCSSPVKIAENIVREYINDYDVYLNSGRLGYTVNIVWFCYILGGWKALASTDLPDQQYYEITYDKNEKKIYFDIYEKKQNIEIEV